MLARSAQGLYWMGRYLKRVEHVSRLMELQVTSLIDRPVRDIHFGWDRLYTHMRISPPLASLEDWSTRSDVWSLVDAFTLADDLTFVSTNDHSIYTYFELARENARQNRHCVSSEMWTCLNRSYFRICDLGIADIWSRTPHHFYAEMVQDVNTFMGVSSATLYRDEGWDFLQIGRMIEHAQLMSSLISYQVDHSNMEMSQEFQNYDWLSLLHCFQADEPYQHYFGMKIDPEKALDMLVTDERLPNSIFFAIDQVNSRLLALGEAPAKKVGAVASRFAGRLASLIKYEWPDAEDRGRMLALTESLAFRLHDQITNAWFNYEVDDSARF